MSDHSSRTRPVRARFGPRPPDAPEESRHAPQSAPRLAARARALPRRPMILDPPPRLPPRRRPRRAGRGAPKAAAHRRPPPSRRARIRAPKGFQVDLLYSVPQADAGLVGEHDGRPQGPADRLGPVRQALPRHAAAGRTGKAEAIGVEPIDVADRRGPRACSGRSTASTWSSTAAGGTTAGSTASATPTATTGSTRSSCCASSTAAASTARTR